MKPLFTYYGGKQQMTDLIISHIPQHYTFIEPFAGGAAVFFAKDLAPRNILNDTNADLINLYKVAQSRPRALKRRIDNMLHSMHLHKECTRLLSSLGGSNLERAAAFWYSCNFSFNSIPGNRPSRSLKKANPYYPTTLANRKDRILEPIIKLTHAELEYMDAIELIEKYDYKEAFFFIDPPYVGAKQGHYSGWTESHLRELVSVMSRLKGKFIYTDYYETANRVASIYGWRVIKNDKILRATNTAGTKTKSLRNIQEGLVLNYE